MPKIKPKTTQHEPKGPETKDLKSLSTEELAVLLNESYSTAQQIQRNIWSINAEISRRMNKKEN
jgi:hypothetical protein